MEYRVERAQFGLPLKMFMSVSAVTEDTRAGTSREGRVRTLASPSSLDVSGPWPSAWGSVTPRLPIEPIWSGVLVNTTVYSFPIWAAWCGRDVARGVRRRRRVRAGRCAACGYTLAGLERCPECGANDRGVSRRASTIVTE